MKLLHLIGWTKFKLGDIVITINDKASKEFKNIRGIVISIDEYSLSYKIFITKGNKYYKDKTSLSMLPEDLLKKVKL